jgi:hypothetical protein
VFRRKVLPVKSLATALVTLLVLIVLPFSHGQTVSTEQCNVIQRKAAISLSEQFLADLRRGLDSPSIRRQYLAFSCQPVLGELFELDNSLTTNTDCELMQEFGAVSMQFFVQLAECGFRADKWPVENPLEALPPEVVRLIHESPALERLFQSDKTEKPRIESRSQLESVIESMRKNAIAASRFNSEHPELAERAAARWAEVEKDVRKEDADCMSSDEATYFGLPTNTPIIVTADSGFVFAIVLDKGELKIARILPASM